MKPAIYKFKFGHLASKPASTFLEATKRRQIKECLPMPEQPPGKPRLPDNFAAFDIDPRRPGRRKARWSLRPTDEGHGSQAPDAARFVKEAELLQGLGRKPVKE
jgi:hypothetical protein